ncbi:MAG: NCS2 family permease [Synergistaceae bacterium]|jgi:AGZA family xanthine/uracil permease-like MFS transporter|nr:NCS2 family permease [Synergistaceae bacterium]
MTSFLEKQFRLQENHTTVKTELIAGVTTFVTMAYIIFVNPDILSKTGMPFGPLMVATCVSAAFATFLMAFLANYPIALASGMGLNAFFAFSVVLNPAMGINWQTALTAVFIEGVIFVLLTLTRLRETVVNAIPKTLKIGVAGGIGLFIAFIGLQGAGIVVANPATLVGLGSIRNNLSISLALGGLVLMAALEHFRVKGSLLIGIVAVTGAGIALGRVSLPESIVAVPPSLAPIFMQFDFSGLGNPDFWIIVFTFFFVDFFDTVGTLVGVCNRSGLLDEQGRLPRAKEALMADAVGTVAGAMLGTSTVTSYVESASGIAQGGRTGLTAVVVGFLFLVSIFFTPLVGIVPSYATAPALIIVGIYMMMGLRDLNFGDWTELTPAMLAFFMMPLAYSIATGIEFGIVSYVVLKIVTGRTKEVNPVMIGLTILFIFKELCA